MSRSDILTIMPLDTYAKYMYIHPAHFNQMKGPKAPVGAGCDKLWDQDGIDSLAWGMSQAEDLIIRELGFYPAPTYVTNELIDLGLHLTRGDWWNAELRTEFSYLNCFGTETLTLKEADAHILYQDKDVGDPTNREETATIGTAVYADLDACDNPEDVRVFFRVADGAEDAADPRWEIRPLKKVDIDGTTMRIEIDSSLLIRPELRLLTKQASANSDDTNAWQIDFALSNLVSRVDIYCASTNKQSPVTLRWDGACTCTGVCEHDTQTACGYITNKRKGYFTARPSTWNGTKNIDAAANFITTPESVSVNYLAGYPYDNVKIRRMNSSLERAIVKLTNVLMPKPICGFCDQAQIMWELDRQDIDPLTPESAGMPWGLYQRGALDAWRIIKRYFARGRGGKIS